MIMQANQKIRCLSNMLILEKLAINIHGIGLLSWLLWEFGKMFRSNSLMRLKSIMYGQEIKLLAIKKQL